MAAAGAYVLVLGSLTFVAFLVLALAGLMPAWAAALLVCVALLAVGGALGWTGLQRLKQVHAPQRTMETLKEDSRWAKETMRSARSQMHGHA
jgi:membrane protein implicated in regulation of membrane protease activity